MTASTGSNQLEAALGPGAAVHAGFVQIELTTVCNYSCSYCAGRAMPQRHMDWALLESIWQRLPADMPGLTVSLQGEGEPTLHPRFWDAVDAVRAHGWQPYTITNGTRIDVERCARSLPTVGMSIDTLDPATSERIGRPHLPKVLDKLAALVAAMGPARIVVHSVDAGQPLAPLRAHLAALGVQHLVQPLQRKPDYVRHYPRVDDAAASMPGMVLAGSSSGVIGWTTAPRPRHCDYLARPRMRYFTIDGVELPCCYIKDVPADFSVERLRTEAAAGRIPATCRGCNELR